ncbi:hypothetical protein ACFVWF_31905 [Rhodococcus qingshengii]|uniref:hypothetical protein n=1 Tax=Rhodococcus qingshengii TaxID=334542 RepID=UPI0036DD7864
MTDPTNDNVTDRGSTVFAVSLMYRAADSPVSELHSAHPSLTGAVESLARHLHAAAVDPIHAVRAAIVEEPHGQDAVVTFEYDGKAVEVIRAFDAFASTLPSSPARESVKVFREFDAFENTEHSAPAPAVAWERAAQTFLAPAPSSASVSDAAIADGVQR